MTILKDYYLSQCKTGVIQEDHQQLLVLATLQDIYDALLQEDKTRKSIWGTFRRPKLIKGLYLWGGVGIGKTFVMDCFYENLPIKAKMRMHFHQFMQYIHEQFKLYAGQKNPVASIAKQIAKEKMLLCFDELTVTDITDAMILARFFDQLFLSGVTIITTSNAKPDDLYPHGLQRQQFLPAIALLKQHTTVMHVTTKEDYRARHLKQAGVFYTPNDQMANEKMLTIFNLLAKGHEVYEEPIEILERKINVVKRANHVIWFDFDVICNPPRSQRDYLALAKQFDTVLISNVTFIPAHAQNRISLLIKLVDVFYDAHIHLILSAEKTVNELYTEGNLIQDYLRTRSRLLEMQSEEYFLSAAKKGDPV